MSRSPLSRKRQLKERMQRRRSVIRRFAASFAGVAGAALLLPGTAVAAPPTVATQPRGPVGYTSAALNGLMNPNSLPATAWLERGQNTSYGSTTEFQSVDAERRRDRSSIHVKTGQTRANDAVLGQITRTGEIAVRPVMPAGGGVHVVIDVAGYFDWWRRENEPT